MENEEAKMVYPSMQQEKVLKREEGSMETFLTKGLTNEEVCIDYPSMMGKGLEEVSLPRPRDIRYGKMEPGSESVRIKDFAAFVGRDIREAFEEGNYKVLEHYEKVFEGAEFFDQRLMPQFKALVEEGKRIANADEGKIFLKKIDNFLLGLRMAKRGGE